MASAVVGSNIFQRCLPAYGTDIKQCGTVTVCDVSTPTRGDLDGIFVSGGNYRVMDALFLQDFEIKSCQTIQNGLYDFLMANKVDMSRRQSKVDMGKGRYMIMPFLLALQKSRINNEYWTVSGGTASGGNWQVDVVSQTSMPSDTRYFNTKMRVFIEGVSSGGTAVRTAWGVVSASVVAGKVRLVLSSQNQNSNLNSTKVPTTSASWPTTGLLYRGTPNVNDYESWCEEGPGLNVNKMVPFWIETVRNSLCTSELYEQYRDMIIDNNPYYAKFADVSEVEKNQQLGADWQRKFVNSFWSNKPLANQNLDSWRSLEQLSTASTAALDVSDEAMCIGYRANAVGVYEQLAECGQVKDLQGQVLNLPELFKALYQIQRIRESNNQQSDSIDIFTDSQYASLIQQAMILYFNNKSGNIMRMTFDISKPPTAGKFGFRFSSYPLDWPVLTMNIVSHRYFDDRIAAAKLVATNQESASRFLWILDFSGIYPGIIASERVVNSSGDLAARAAVDATYMCVMKVPTRKQTLTSTTYSVIVECPASSLILENISSAVPEYKGVSNDQVIDYYGSY